MNEREAYVALNMTEKIGPIGVRSLVSQLGSARAIFTAERSRLTAAQGIGREMAEVIVSGRDRVDWEEELARTAGMGAEIVTQVDEAYPKSLLEIHDPPLALYVKGTLHSGDRHAIAVVGTRRPTHYGLESAGKLAFQLAKSGFTVVSGLAEGIDTAAHQGALRAKGRTLSVMGSALDCPYPASNRDLARRISERGAVISEFPLGRQPDKTTFPMRNRIVSGLAMGVLVVEAGLNSGALITANQALDQGRSVFAVPGRIDSYVSRGTHELIRTGARLVADADDVLREFEFLLPPGPKERAERSRIGPELSKEETCLVRLLEQGEQGVDSLIRASALKPASVNALLIGLEMKRVIRMLPGRIVEMVNR